MRRNLERLLRELYSAPRNPEVDARKEKFEQLNQTIRASHGFVTSIPGDVEVRFDALPGSTLPDELCNAGYDVRDLRDGERILATAITEQFTLNAGFEPLTQGSTKPIASIVTHAGIVKVKRFAFDMP
jgi:hypothetical protein